MISIKNSKSVSTVTLTDHSVVVSACPSGFSNLGTGVSGVAAVRPEPSLVLDGLVIRERGSRPTEALEAEAAAKALAYGFAATGAGLGKRQTKQHHTMWAFRGLEPWSDPA
ncbi:hypothetical protein GT204_20950 [Streptomyces sp. SID4919]|uniref:hypothetical protein n=1 Tax=unclassified Streptomyces TaxID=2593676 RepID=UPI000823C7A5|nr:hypothetical protein [Streptomyces sp. AmelKG-E11A]MYY11309.1 hypothetical protein [Streptomyces sp. SID4919]SCK17424.1 hypothetical protein YW7DRAFT_01209 [Streptomyces sp. AmelKG-E11A]